MTADIELCLKKRLLYLMVVILLVDLLGNGYSFVMRDAHGIRPAYYYINDEVIVAA